MKLYKLTDENDQTYGGCQWGENVQHYTSGEGKMCGPGWTYWYVHPLLAVFLNIIHGQFDLTKAHLWEGEGTVGIDDGLKVGCADGKTIKRVPLPEVTFDQRVKFGILCAKHVRHGPGQRPKKWNEWADKWLSGDRSVEVESYTQQTFAVNAGAYFAGLAVAANAAKDFSFIYQIAQEAVK